MGLNVCSFLSTTQVKDVVSEKMIGEMRIQFWRDAIDLAYQVSLSVHQITPSMSWDGMQ